MTEHEVQIVMDNYFNAMQNYSVELAGTESGKLSHIIPLNKSIFFSNMRLERFILPFDSCIASIK